MICIQLSGSLPPDGAVPNNNTSAPNLNASSIFSKIGISLSILHTSETDFPALLLSITQVIGLELYLGHLYLYLGLFHTEKLYKKFIYVLAKIKDFFMFQPPL